MNCVLCNGRVIAGWSCRQSGDSGSLIGGLGETLIFQSELIIGFDMVGVNRDAINRTDLDTLGSLEMAYTFRAPLPVNLINDFALINRIIGALRLTDITIDALVSDEKSHGIRDVRESSRERLTEFVNQGVIDIGMHEFTDVATVACNFLDQACRDEGLVFRRRQENRFDATVEFSIHQG